VIVDAHHHMWAHPENPYLAKELRGDTQTVEGVARTIYVECGSSYRATGPPYLRPVGETEFVVAAEPTGFVAGIVGFADLRGPMLADCLDRHIEAGRGRFRGIRQANAWDPSSAIRAAHTDPPPGLLADQDFRHGLALLGKADLSFDAWMFHPQLPELADLARAHPDVVIVLNHLGGPLGIGPYAGRRVEVLDEWRTSMTDVARCENVMLKLGGIGMSIFGHGWHRQPGGATVEQLVNTWGTEVQWCIEQFGVHRCMFESNFPVDKVSCSYAVLWTAFDAIAAGASTAERNALFAGTATKVYRL
jgi:L-fuconolactonase